MSNEVKCQQCGTLMKRDVRVIRSMGLQVIGVLLFLLGLILLFFIPIGTIIGLILMIAAARMGYSRQKVWKCGNCGYFFERAK